MAVAPGEIVRDWVGAQPDDATISAQLARWPDDPKAPQRAALAILRRRYADLEGGPGSVTVAGQAGWSTRADQMESIARKVAALAGEVGEPAGIAGLPALSSTPIGGPGNLR